MVLVVSPGATYIWREFSDGCALGGILVLVLFKSTSASQTKL